MARRGLHSGCIPRILLQGVEVAQVATGAVEEKTENLLENFLVGLRNPRPLGGVKGTGYAGPGWVWPKGLPSATFTLGLCRNAERREVAVSRFRKLSHTIWHCQYHITWVPKYRFRILTGPLGQSVAEGIQAICGYAGAEVVELNVQGIMCI